MIFYIDALMLLQSNVRKCKALAIQESVAKISHLMFCPNQPIYEKYYLQ